MRTGVTANRPRCVLVSMLSRALQPATASILSSLDARSFAPLYCPPLATFSAYLCLLQLSLMLCMLRDRPIWLYAVSTVELAQSGEASHAQSLFQILIWNEDFPSVSLFIRPR